MVYYTIYKITNSLNGKTYIGKHQTKQLDDSYMGSGKLIKRAVDKYGVDNFSKELLHVFDNEEEMNAKEQELVTQDVVESEQTYNLCVGGQGGFSHINSQTELRIAKNKRARKAANANGALDKAKQRHVSKREDYSKSPKLCPVCTTIIPFEKRLRNKFCSSSCQATVTNRTRKLTTDR